MHETNDLEDGYLGSGKRLKRAIRYYGKEFFERRILHIFDNKEDMVNKEIELVNEEFVNREDTYNLVKGGKGGFISLDGARRGAITMNKKHWERRKNDPIFNEKCRSACSNSMKKLHREGKIKYDNFKGKKHTEETKVKMRASHKGKQEGKKNSQYGTCWITNEIENKKIFKGDEIPNGWRLGRVIKNKNKG